MVKTKVKLKGLTKTTAVRALKGMNHEAILKQLRAYRRMSGEAEFELMKFLVVYEVSELWAGLGRYNATSSRSAFESFLDENRDWMVSITLFRRFKQAINELNEKDVQAIGMYAVQHAWRIDKEGVRSQVVQQMLKEAQINQAPLSEAQARVLVRGKTARPKRKTSDAELQQAYERMNAKVATLQANIDVLKEAERELKTLEAEKEQLRQELDEAKKLLARYRERFGDIDAPSAKSHGKAGSRPRQSRGLSQTVV